MSVKKQVGSRIQELRIKRGLKQSELAEKVGIATKHQSCIETGKNFPSADLLEKFSIALNIDVAEILNIKNEKDKKTQLSEIQEMLANASDKEISIIYKFINSIIY